MAKPAPIDASEFTSGDFVGSVRREDLVYFLLNVGDGDAQVILLPTQNNGTDRTARRAIVVDAAIVDKVPALLKNLESANLFGGGDSSPVRGSIALVVATHPHLDHIGGIPQLLSQYRGSVAEFWDPVYFHPIGEYHGMMTEIERAADLVYAQPASGTKRWIGDVAVTVLSPSIQLRNRFDSYGVEINDASISLKLDYPASRVQQRGSDREYLGRRTVVQSLILGADAQTVSWSYVLTDYPYLAGSTSAAARALRMATGADPLRAKILKISHHASKRGVNLELIERIRPNMMLVSCVGGGGQYNFPHDIAQEILREAVERTAGSNATRSSDADLKLFYTADEDTAGNDLGSIAVVLARGRDCRLWRFGDSPQQDVDLSAGRLMPNAC